MYKKCASRLVELTLDGYNNTIFAYGQTGSGKTYTMTGANTGSNTLTRANMSNFEHRGIIPRAISQLYRDIERRSESEISVRVSYVEIYKEKMFDLLQDKDGGGGNPLTITEDEQVMK